jgi:hypothetical protein
VSTQRDWLIYAKVLDMYLGGVKQTDIATPCCGQMLCWVNPRLPNYLDRVYRAR